MGTDIAKKMKLSCLLAGLVLGRSPTMWEGSSMDECDLTCESAVVRLDYVEEQLKEVKQDVEKLHSQNSQLQERVDSLHTQVNGMRENGIYEIQPTLSYEPFEALCTFDKDEVETSLKRNHAKWPTYTATPGGSDGCSDPGCYKDKITY